MAVLVQDLNLIVRVSALVRKYPGGVLQFQRDSLDDSFCCDGLLARVGSPARLDVEVSTDRLKEKGFVLADEFGFRDMAIVDELRGLPVGCFWLETGRRENGLGYAFARGSDPEALIAVPRGWSLESWQAMEEARPTGEARGSLLFIRREGENEIFLNRRTGQEVRVSKGKQGGVERVVN